MPAEFKVRRVKIGDIKRRNVGHSRSRMSGRTLAVLAFVTLVAIVGGLQMFAIVTHHPHLMYPPGAEASLIEARRLGGGATVSREFIQQLMKAYHLDEDCTEGEKYGALCQDGTVDILYAGSDTCSDHGGVKEWIECR